MDAFQEFADNYTSSDLDKIKFDWNGKHADEFRDTNSKFRTDLCEYLIPQLENVKLELIRDLYLELAKWAKEAWGVYNKFHLFGQQLLTRGGEKYLLDYMQGASLSMDTYLGSGRVEISREHARQLLDYIDNKIESSADEKERRLCEGFRERFEWLSNK